MDMLLELLLLVHDFVLVMLLLVFIIALSCILLLVRVKFAEISFHVEFVDYSPCCLPPCSYVLDHCSYGLGPKERKMFCVTML
jgi:hypothetical protein